MFTEEQKQLLDTKFGDVVTQLEAKMNAALSGLAKRLVVDELPKVVKGEFTPLLEKLTEMGQAQAGQPAGLTAEQYRTMVREEMNALLDGLATEETPAEGGQGGTQQQPANLTAEIERIKAELQAGYQKEIDAVRASAAELKKQADEERQKAADIAKQDRIRSMDDRLLDIIRPHVRQGGERDLLTLLKSKNLLHEVEGSSDYLLDGTDDLGLPTKVAAADILPNLIQEQFSYLVDRRPGTGSGAAPAGTVSGAQSGRYFAGNQAPSEADMLDPAKRAAMLAELDAMPAA